MTMIVRLELWADLLGAERLPRRLPFDLPLPFDLRRASLRHLTFCRSIKYYKAFTALQDHARNRLIRAL
jgi:hypothetical protein